MSDDRRNTQLSADHRFYHPTIAQSRNGKNDEHQYRFQLSFAPVQELDFHATEENWSAWKEVRTIGMLDVTLELLRSGDRNPPDEKWGRTTVLPDFIGLDCSYLPKDSGRDLYSDLTASRSYLPGAMWVQVVEGLAKEGVTPAQVILGQFYLDLDEVRAERWLKMAATQHDAHGVLLYGNYLFERSKGIPETNERLQELLEKRKSAIALFEEGKALGAKDAERHHREALKEWPKLFDPKGIWRANPLRGDGWVLSISFYERGMIRGKMYIEGREDGESAIDSGTIEGDRISFRGLGGRRRFRGKFSPPPYNTIEGSLESGDGTFSELNWFR